MVQKTTEQVAGAMDYATNMLVIAAVVAALTFAALRCDWRRQRNSSESHPTEAVNPPVDHGREDSS